MSLLIRLNDLDDLFDLIPPTVVARHLGFKYPRIKELQQHPVLWRIVDLIVLGRFFDADARGILNIALNQIDKNTTQSTIR